MIFSSLGEGHPGPWGQPPTACSELSCTRARPLRSCKHCRWLSCHHDAEPLQGGQCHLPHPEQSAPGPSQEIRAPPLPLPLAGSTRLASALAGAFYPGSSSPHRIPHLVSLHVAPTQTAGLGVFEESCKDVALSPSSLFYFYSSK